ncbi:bestrophin/UPF0187 family protein [Rhodotorula toruloides]|uniref:Bestrophin/UPF0187 family protein n=1 Tax=Rhodotorula toruloides TaxID=5286 RepID=A0A511KFG6_RHOTO|nr:bestrophin/UPF0187 family protein [Rhodotorula toruloides]
MAEAVSNVLETIAGQLADLPQPFSSLSLLEKEEEEDAKRIRTSRVGWWRDFFRIRGSTLPRIWRSILGFTIWATGIAVADLVFDRKLSMTNNVTPLLSVVVGLLLVFRNGSAYARWDEGRKTFAKMSSIARSLSRSVWVSIGAPPPVKPVGDNATLKPPSSSVEEGVTANVLDEKVKVLRLIVAFVVATKHHVRREYGVDWPADHATSSHEPLLAEIRRVSSKRSATSLLSAEESNIGVPPLASPRSFASARGGEGERRPLLGRNGGGRRATFVSTDNLVVLADYMAKPSLPLPLVIAHQLSVYFASCKRRSLLESIGPAGYNALTTSVSQLVDCFTTVEALAHVGIPTVYGIHLKQCTSLFLLTLPFVLCESMGFTMIPFVTVVAFTLTGIEAVATEVEMPFGVDDSDLNLDLFCAELRNEVEHVISRLPASTDEWEL